MDKPDGRINRSRTAGGKKDIVQVARRTFGDFACEPRGSRVGVVKGREISKVPSLLSHGLCNLLSPITDLGAPHASRSVDQAFAFFVHHMDAAGTFNKCSVVFAQGCHPFPRVQEVVVVPVLGVRVIHGGPYFLHSSQLGTLHAPERLKRRSSWGNGCREWNWPCHGRGPTDQFCLRFPMYLYAHDP